MGRLLDETIQSAELRELLDIPKLRALRDEHRTGSADHSELLWGVLNLGLWRRSFRV
jgi:hypothetical protein